MIKYKETINCRRLYWNSYHCIYLWFNLIWLFITLDKPVEDALKWVKREENCFEGDSVSTCEFLDTYDEFIQVCFLNKLFF